MDGAYEGTLITQLRTLDNTLLMLTDKLCDRLDSLTWEVKELRQECTQAKNHLNQMAEDISYYVANKV